MNVIQELESRKTPREKESLLKNFTDSTLADLYLIYGRKGYATREEKIILIANCMKTQSEKFQTLKRALVSAKRAKSLFSALGDKEEVAAWTRIFKRLKSWRRYFENEKD